jgi:hypothetical protein
VLGLRWPLLPWLLVSWRPLPPAARLRPMAVLQGNPPLGHLDRMGILPAGWTWYVLSYFFFYDEVQILTCGYVFISKHIFVQIYHVDPYYFFLMPRGSAYADPGVQNRNQFFMMTRGSGNADPVVRTVINFHEDARIRECGSGRQNDPGVIHF